MLKVSDRQLLTEVYVGVGTQTAHVCLRSVLAGPLGGLFILRVSSVHCFFANNK